MSQRSSVLATPVSTSDGLFNNLISKLSGSDHDITSDHVTLQTTSFEQDRPNWWISNPECLYTKSELHSFVVGTGENIFRQMQPAFESAEEELVIITCFWARSTSLDLLVKSLHKLSTKASQRSDGRKIKVFIGLSSLSLFQKLFQTSSQQGHVYSAGEYPRKLWIPPPTEFPGLEITIKSIFYLPFSVMHPKFVIVDRKLVWLPSCNVSWENWFEGAGLISGEVVKNFVHFWEEFWLCKGHEELDVTDASISLQIPVQSSEIGVLGRVDFEDDSGTETYFLPSAHHRNPRFSFFSTPTPPKTPLNMFLLLCIESARKRIFFQTPNVTSLPVIASLKDAIQRGVNLHIRTSESLMILEQLVTAWTTTSRSINNLINWYLKQKRLIEAEQRRDVESQAGRARLGRLKIEYFSQVTDAESDSNEPVQTHLKMSVFDDQTVVLGSGNMDRASWFTSQELGVAFTGEQKVRQITRAVEGVMRERLRVRYDSDEGKSV